MVNYQLGKISKIVDNTNNNIYIGSTCEPTLARRLATHLTDYKRREIRNNNMTSLQIFDNNNYDIILIENYPCERKDELHARERYYIESLKCVNKVIPTRTDREYVEANKEKIELYRKIYYAENKEGKIKEYLNTHKEEYKTKRHEYYLNNKDDIQEKSKNKLECSCGIEYTVQHKARHEKSQFHQNYLNTNNKEKRKIVIECLCGGIYNQYSNFFKERHEKTIKHQNYINNLCTIQS